MSFTQRDRYVVFRNAVFPLGGRVGGATKGYCYICPECGDKWGEVGLSPLGKFTIIVWPCDDHGDEYRRGGSLLTPILWWDALTGSDLRKAWPKFSPEFQRHELLARAGQILGDNPFRSSSGNPHSPIPPGGA